MKKSIFLAFLVILLLPSPMWSQRQGARPYWYSLEQGKFYFRNRDYGKALMAFEQARRDRRTMYTRMEQDIIDLLSIPEVRYMGDSLERIEEYIKERYQVNAEAALEELYYRYPKANLEGSAYRALEEISRLKDFPEAEYWIGETFRMEGELGVALGQYQKAYAQRTFLENPRFDTEILYRMVDVLKTKQDYTEMENWALEILKQDSLWSGGSGIVTKHAMTTILENRDNGIRRFLTIYRYSNTVVERAHRLLGLYYYASGRHKQAADHLMFSFLIQNTILLQEVIRNQFDFTFTDLESLIHEAVKRPALAAYIQEVEYYKTIYYFAAALYSDGNTKQAAAKQLWGFLSAAPERGEWAAKARLQLRDPFVEKAVEMP
jgi:tetratricopeptide (TPR) repeat protein